MYANSPVIILPFRYVPVHKMIVFAWYTSPSSDTMPFTTPSSMSNSLTMICFTLRFSVFSKTSFIRRWYATLSDWARKECTAGPFPVLSMRIWIAVASALMPISPPNASSSHTRWLLPGPPMAGLHGIRAMLSKFNVAIKVRCPMRAVAKAASQPA